MEIQCKNRSLFLIAILLVIFSGYTIQLIRWQLIEGDIYREKADKSNSYAFKTDPIRGEIVDCRGVGFAVNFTGRKIYFDKFSINKDKINDMICDLITLIESKGQKWIDSLPIEDDGINGYRFVTDKDEQIKDLKSKAFLNMNSYASANECMQKLIEKYDCKNYSKDIQRKIISVRYNMTRTGFDNSYTTPYTFADGVNAETISIISEKSDDFPGVHITTSSVRKTVHSTIAPHLIGYVGLLSQEEYDTLKDKGYNFNDKIGKTGIESAMETELRGKGGHKSIEINRKGTVMNVLNTENAQPGNTIWLTLDARLQQVANRSLERCVKASANDCIAGGVVALSVKDFSVLAASTYPGYDLNLYLNDPTYRSKILCDEKYKPQYDRTRQGGFAPGSTFKVAVACAALQEGKITESSTLNCARILHLDGMSLHCHTGTHGNVSVIRAMAASCNLFFAQAGQIAGIDVLNHYSRKLGLGVPTGLEIYEESGKLAGKNTRDNWSAYDSMQASIGQSDNLITPIQLATYAATIANGGHRYRTHLVRKVTNYGRNELIWENNPDNPELIEETNISEQNIDIIKRSMRAVITSGTGTALSKMKVPIAGKTGTAETGIGRSDNRSFICFAPYDNPEIAIGIIIERGGLNCPYLDVVKDILNAYFSDNNMEDIPDARIEETTNDAP